MIQFHPQPTAPLTQRSKSIGAALPLVIAAGVFAFATAPVTKGAGIVANGSGSLLGAGATDEGTAVFGAVTLTSFDAVITAEAIHTPAPSSDAFEATETNYDLQTAPATSFYSPSLSSDLGAEETSAFSDVTAVPEPATWLFALLAAGTSLWFARTHLARRRLVPVQNT